MEAALSSLPPAAARLFSSLPEAALAAVVSNSIINARRPSVIQTPHSPSLSATHSQKNTKKEHMLNTLPVSLLTSPASPASQARQSNDCAELTQNIPLSDCPKVFPFTFYSNHQHSHD
jgi:hypothetical protein